MGKPTVQDCRDKGHKIIEYSGEIRTVSGRVVKGRYCFACKLWRKFEDG